MSTNNIVMGDAPVSRSSFSEDSQLASFTQQTMSDIDAMEEEHVEETETVKRHFFRRSAPWWSRFLVLATSFAAAVTVAPRLHIFTQFVCKDLQPHLAGLTQPLGPASFSVRTRYNGWVTPVPPPSCEQDLTVKETVTGLVTAMDLVMGVLSCLTVGYWMQLSDRYGRVKILLVAAIGVVINHVIVIMISATLKGLPGGYHFFLLGPIIEGILGGRIVLSSILLAYITDISSLNLRTVNLGIATAIDILGNSWGQSFVEFLVKYSVGLPFIYYFATTIYISLIFAIIYHVPESMSKSKLNQARRMYTLARAESSPNEPASDDDQDLSIADILEAKYRNFKRLLSISFEALTIFLPHRPQAGHPDAPWTGRWDWNLFLVGCAFFVKSIAGSDVKYLSQYFQRVLPWNSQDVGSWFRYVNTIHVLGLIIIFPFFIRWLRNKIGAKSQNPHSSQADYPSPDDLENLDEADYIIVLASMAILVMSMFSMVFVKGPIALYGVIIYRSLSLGYEAALKSLALSLYARRTGHNLESGKVLGGLGVLGWISGNIIGPAIFEPLYNHTQEYFPQAMLLVAGVLGVVALIITLPVRIMEKIEI